MDRMERAWQRGKIRGRVTSGENMTQPPSPRLRRVSPKSLPDVERATTKAEDAKRAEQDKHHTEPRKCGTLEFMRNQERRGQPNPWNDDTGEFNAKAQGAPSKDFLQLNRPNTRATARSLRDSGPSGVPCSSLAVSRSFPGLLLAAELPQTSLRQRHHARTVIRLERGRLESKGLLEHQRRFRPLPEPEIGDCGSVEDGSL